VRRSAPAEDQRQVIAELTPAGRTLISNVFPDHVARLREVMAGLSAADKRAASRLLRKLSRHAGQVSTPDVGEVTPPTR